MDSLHFERVVRRLRRIQVAIRIGAGVVSVGFAAWNWGSQTALTLIFATVMLAYIGLFQIESFINRSLNSP